MDTDYYPVGCQFYHRLSTAQSLNACFMKAKVSEIVISGIKLFNRLLYYLEELNGKFRGQPINNSPNSLYSAIPGIGMTIHESLMHASVGGTLALRRQYLFGKFSKPLTHASSRLEYIIIQILLSSHGIS